MKLSGKQFKVHSYKTAYFEYCEFIRELAKQALDKEKPYYAEMLLFAAAPTWIVNDILRRTKVTICLTSYTKGRYDPIAMWFSEKQKLLGKNLTLPKLPPVEISDDEPPALREKRNGDEKMPTDDIKFDVESLLGCYDAAQKRVLIWRKGIEFCCRFICPEAYDKMFELVLVHELGHWFHNEAKTEGGECWDQARLAVATEEYSEAWAQWFAWVYANEKGGDRCKMFLDLEKKQSEPYKAWEKVFKKDFDLEWQTRILRCLPQLRQDDRGLDMKSLRKCIEKAIFNKDLDPETALTFGDFIAEL